MKHLSVAVSLTALMWACDGNNPSPTQPPLSMPPAATNTLSGVVTVVTPAGQAPSEGARVELSNGLAATTDMGGSYRFDRVHAGPTSVRVSAYACDPVTRDVTIEGDTRLDVQVAFRATYTLSGVVSEATPNGLIPIEGVEVSDSYFHASARTNRNGFYSFTGPFGSGISYSFYFAKKGYQEAERAVTINGDTRLDIQLVRP